MVLNVFSYSNKKKWWLCLVFIFICIQIIILTIYNSCNIILLLFLNKLVFNLFSGFYFRLNFHFFLTFPFLLICIFGRKERRIFSFHICFFQAFFVRFFISLVCMKMERKGNSIQGNDVAIILMFLAKEISSKLQNHFTNIFSDEIWMKIILIIYSSIKWRKKQFLARFS